MRKANSILSPGDLSQSYFAFYVFRIGGNTLNEEEKIISQRLSRGHYNVGGGGGAVFYLDFAPCVWNT